MLKTVVADNLVKLVDPVFGGESAYNGANVLLATYAFSFQIYCDFAGYSFMAIGLALMMGFGLMENFRRPYFSRNISDFWRRWHISLSSWFRDYFFSPLFIYMEKRPLLRKLTMKQRHAIAFFLSLLFAEFMLGLWHGAGWNFVSFGVFHGLAIWAYYSYKTYWDRMPVWLQIFLMYQIACFGWLIFRAKSLNQAYDMLESMVVNFSPADWGTLSGDILFFMVLVLPIVCVQTFQERSNDTLILLRFRKPLRLASILTMFWITMLFGVFNSKPFIYFQF